ncbi:hypothetical protein, partial [Alistipes putredinis]|uniref:hypothetical protein n=1 Tax=Alistipes putredinis TaxID=28117 RepID=UPI003AB2750B
TKITLSGNQFRDKQKRRKSICLAPFFVHFFILLKMYLGNYLCNAENFSKACCCFEFAEIYRRIFFIIRNQAFFAVFFYVNTAIKKKNTYFPLANTGA